MNKRRLSLLCVILLTACCVVFAKKSGAVKNDSIAASEKANVETIVQRDSPNSLDTSLAILKRQINNLASIHKRIERDSQSLWKQNNVTLKSVIETLHELRSFIAKTDSIVKESANLLTTLVDEAQAVYSKSVQGYQDRDREINSIDSASLVLQNRKITFFNFKEKLKLDSAIAVTNEQLIDANKNGAPVDSITAKQQFLESCKAKQTAFLRERELAAMAARYHKTGREEAQRQIDAQLARVQNSLDSLTLAREKLAHDNFFLEREFMEKSKLFKKRSDTLSVSITRISNALTTLKERIPTFEKDSAEAFKRQTTMTETTKKK